MLDEQRRSAFWPDPPAQCRPGTLVPRMCRWCPTCQMWLADAVQFEDHIRGKRHRRAAGLCKPKTRKDPVRAMAREFAREHLDLLYIIIAARAQRVHA